MPQLKDNENMLSVMSRYAMLENIFLILTTEYSLDFLIKHKGCHKFTNNCRFGT